MTHPALVVQSVFHQALVNDAELTGLLGGQYVFDHVPQRQKPPYVVFAEAIHNDWATGTEPGMEHAVSLNVWSRENGRKQVLQIADAMHRALSGLPAVFDGQAIVNSGHEFTEISRDEETDYFLAKVNYRVVTEPAA